MAVNIAQWADAIAHISHRAAQEDQINNVFVAVNVEEGDRAARERAAPRGVEVRLREERLGQRRADEPRRHRVDAHAVRAPLACVVARCPDTVPEGVSSGLWRRPASPRFEP